MAIEQTDVISMIRECFPEFEDAIKEHLADWPDDPMLYLLMGPLFRRVAAPQPGKERERLQLARRVYEFVDRMLLEGSPSVRDCFAIEFIEPLWNDPKATERDYPGLESVLGPAGKKELAAMREWWRRYVAMKVAIGRLNEQLGQAVFSDVGIGEGTARVIVEPLAWLRMSERCKDEVYRQLRSDWEGLTGKAKGLMIAGPRDTGFEVLRGG